MTYYTDQTYIKELDGHTYTIKLHPEYDNDTTHLGEYKRSGDTWCIWRKDGTLRGDYPDLPEPLEPQDEPYTVDSRAWDLYEQAYEMWEIATSEPTILASDLHTSGWNELDYFVPFAGGMDPDEDPDEWAKYALQDYARMESLNRGDWGYVFLMVETQAPACPTCGRIDTLYSSLGGIESDMDDTDLERYIMDCISDIQGQLAAYSVKAA